MGKMPSASQMTDVLDACTRRAIVRAYRKAAFKAVERRLKQAVSAVSRRRIVYRVSVVSEFWLPQKSELPLTRKELACLTVARTLDGKVHTGIQVKRAR